VNRFWLNVDRAYTTISPLVWSNDVTRAADQILRSRCAFAIMAKAPDAGRTKTRLSPPLSPQEATELGCCFLRDMTANLALAARSVPIDPFVAFAPAGSETEFAGVVQPETGLVLADGSLPAPAGISGLGICLLQAVSSLLARGYGAVALLNADSPNLPTALLTEAASMLSARQERVVLGPSSDGGYYLIGMGRAYADLFREIDWSSARVADQTRARAASLALDLVELAPWYDVDDAASLCALITDLQQPSGAAAPYPAAATRHFIHTGGIAERLHAHLDARPYSILIS
jgi:uncharacterized protein